MAFVEKIRRDLTAAMKADDKVRVSILRMLVAALHNEEIEFRRSLQTEDVVRVVKRLARQSRESIREFHRGGRGDLVKKEEQELEILREYMPEMIEEEEIEGHVGRAIAEVGASEPKDLGRVMAVLMPRLAGKADGAVVNRIVREKLGQS